MIFPLKGKDPETNATIQSQIRKNAEAFLCKRLIVCEGKTEIGFVRALDTYLAKTKNYRMAFKGVGTADGGGSTIFTCTEVLRSCGYEVCLLMDSDLPDEDEQKQICYGMEFLFLTGMLPMRLRNRFSLMFLLILQLK